MKILSGHALALAVVSTLSLPAAAIAGKTAPAKAAKAAKAPAAAKGAPAPAAAAAAPAPTKAASFEEARANAWPAGDLGALVEPLYSVCPTKDDLARRQCELIKNWHLERLKTRTWYAVADAVAMKAEPYDSTVKTVTVGINGCLSCTHPPVVAGEPRVIATAPPKGMDEGYPIGIDVSSKDLPFEDAKKAGIWANKIRPRLRVEFIFGVGQPFDAKSATKGVSISLIGHRLYDSCFGDVLASEPPSKDPVKIAARDATCPADKNADYNDEFLKEQAKLPDTLSRKQVQDAMAPVQGRVYECGEVFELKQGVARVHVTLKGNGESKMTIGEPYDKGDVYLCIKEALKDAKFPLFKFNSPPVEIDYPFVLRK